MHRHRGKIVLLPPNRVWRTYLGGRTLDALAGVSAASDTHFPEDWIASTTRAVNPGREAVTEGVSPVMVADEKRDLTSLLADDPAYFLGEGHQGRFGARPMLLVKLLDSAIRLHFQVHPTADFARRLLNSTSGKTEAYHVLATRPEVAQPYIYLGFQRPPSRAALRQMIETQDIAALEACFDKIPVAPGDTFVVPGGVPHALGEGVFLVEIQEPSDLVVRFEFERAGYILPESARFMGRGLDFCLDVFDLTEWSPARLASAAVCRPEHLRSFSPTSWQEQLIGADKTTCFRATKSHLYDSVSKSEDSFYIGIVTDGSCTITAGGETHHLKRYDKFLCPAGLGPVRFDPSPRAEILECYPPV